MISKNNVSSPSTNNPSSASACKIVIGTRKLAKVKLNNFSGNFSITEVFNDARNHRPCYSFTKSQFYDSSFVNKVDTFSLSDAMGDCGQLYKYKVVGDIFITLSSGDVIKFNASMPLGGGQSSEINTISVTDANGDEKLVWSAETAIGIEEHPDIRLEDKREALSSNSDAPVEDTNMPEVSSEVQRIVKGRKKTSGTKNKKPRKTSKSNKASSSNSNRAHSNQASNVPVEPAITAINVSMPIHSQANNSLHSTMPYPNMFVHPMALQSPFALPPVHMASSDYDALVKARLNINPQKRKQSTANHDILAYSTSMVPSNSSPNYIAPTKRKKLENVGYSSVDQTVSSNILYPSIVNAPMHFSANNITPIIPTLPNYLIPQMLAHSNTTSFDIDTLPEISNPFSPSIFNDVNTDLEPCENDGYNTNNIQSSAPIIVQHSSPQMHSIPNSDPIIFEPSLLVTNDSSTNVLDHDILINEDENILSTYMPKQVADFDEYEFLTPKSNDLPDFWI